MRPLTDKQIETLIQNTFSPLPKLPKRIQERVYQQYSKRCRKNLDGIQLHPEIFIEFQRKLAQRIITPGESVGIITGQSIGERQTQSTLDSFHRTGLSEKKTLSGVPRFSEIIDTTRSEIQSSRTCYIYLVQKPQTLQEIKEIVGCSLIERKFSSIIKDVSFEEHWTRSVDWLPVFCDFYNLNFEKYKHRIVYHLDLDKLFRFNITLESISSRIMDEFDSVVCAFSPLCLGEIHVYVDDPGDVNLMLLEDDSINLVYMEEVVHKTLRKTIICGIEGITNCFYFKNDDNEWFIETDGSNLLEILTLPFVDIYRTFSNDIWEIYNIFGVETARSYILYELSRMMSGINSSHLRLLVERMTVSGRLCSISRYTRKKEKSSVLSKTTFEETLDGFLKAGIQGEKDNVNGVSASLVCGKVSSVGTGIIDLKYKF